MFQVAYNSSSVRCGRRRSCSSERRSNREAIREEAERCVPMSTSAGWAAADQFHDIKRASTGSTPWTPCSPTTASGVSEAEILMRQKEKDKLDKVLGIRRIKASRPGVHVDRSARTSPCRRRTNWEFRSWPSSTRTATLTSSIVIPGTMTPSGDQAFSPTRTPSRGKSAEDASGGTDKASSRLIRTRKAKTMFQGVEASAMPPCQSADGEKNAAREEVA